MTSTTVTAPMAPFFSPDGNRARAAGHGMASASAELLPAMAATEPVLRPPGNPGVPSPCTGVCRMDPDTAQCQGCLRTIDEIRAWRGMSDGQRLRLWRLLRERRELLPGDPGA